jgi:methyl-accepting chemotaxis protein
MKKRTLEFKLIVGGLLMVLIPLLVIGIVTTLRSSNALVKTSMEGSEQIAKSISNMVQLVLQEEVKVVTHIASNNTVLEAVAGVAKNGIEGSTEEISRANKALETLFKKSGTDYEFIVITDAGGKVIADSSGESLRLNP